MTPRRCCNCCWKPSPPRSTGAPALLGKHGNVQVTLAASPALVGPCGDAWIEKWLAPDPGSRTRLRVENRDIPACTMHGAVICPIYGATHRSLIPQVPIRETA